MDGVKVMHHSFLTSTLDRGEYMCFRPKVKQNFGSAAMPVSNTRVGTLIMATISLQLMQNRYMFRSFTVLHCSHQHCVQPVASDVEVVGYL